MGQNRLEYHTGFWNNCYIAVEMRHIGLISVFWFVCISVSCSPRDGWAGAKAVEKAVREPSFRSCDYVITDFGTDFEDARTSINDAIAKCSREGGGRVIVPGGKWFCKGPIVLLSGVNLHFEDGAELVFSTDPADFLPCVLTRWEGTEVYNYSPMVYAYNQHNIALTGRGVLNGQGKAGFETWKAIQKPDQRELRRMGREGVPVQERVFGEGHFLRPAMMDLMACSDVLLEDVKIVDGTFWSFHLIGCNSVTARRLSVDCTNYNSDGVDPESSSNVIIEDCYFHTGDDCIAVKSGRDQDGWRLGRPSENILIRRCTFETASNGICIGSEISGGVRRVFVEDCHIINAKQGLYFKSNQDRGGYIEDVFVRNITVDNVDSNLIKFEPAYKNEGSQYFPTPMRHFRISGVRAGSAGSCGIYLIGFEDVPVEDVIIKDLTLENTPQPADMAHYKGLVLEHVSINGEPFIAASESI